MHCVLISGDPTSITIRRSVEVLGYQSKRKEVVILFAVPGRSVRSLNRSVLHRGNVDLWFALLAAASTSLRGRGDRDARDRECVLNRVYGSFFQEAEDRALNLHAGLGFGDREYSVDTSTPVERFTPPFIDPPALTSMELEDRIRPLGDFVPSDKYIPFTVWNIGPFRGSGSRILSFLMRISGSNYDALVGREDYFTIDGPERLLSRIIHGDLTTQAFRLDRSLPDRILPFKASMLFSAAYDVIVLGRPLASQTTVHMLNGAENGQIQPDQHHRRFITQTPHFSITLRFEESNFKQTWNGDAKMRRQVRPPARHAWIRPL